MIDMEIANHLGISSTWCSQIHELLQSTFSKYSFKSRWANLISRSVQLLSNSIIGEQSEGEYPVPNKTYSMGRCIDDVILIRVSIDICVVPTSICP